MEIEELEIVQLELKYCERCGGLWLRLRGSGQVYCAGCAEQEKGLPVRRRKTKRPVNGNFELKSAKGNEQAWLLPAVDGGNA